MQTLKHANKLLPTKTMTQLYYSQIFPHLIGEILIWGTAQHQAHYIQPLIRTQKRIIRLLLNLPPRAHTKPLMRKLQILNINNLYIHRTCMFMHPFMYPKPSCNRPKHNNHPTTAAQIHDYPTRFSRAKHCFIPNPLSHKYSTTKTTTHQTSHLASQALQIWNTLPAALRAIPSRVVFGKDLKKLLLERQEL